MEINQKDFEYLETLTSAFNQTELVRLLKQNKDKISLRTKKLRGLGLIRTYKVGRFKYSKLTDQGKYFAKLFKKLKGGKK